MASGKIRRCHRVGALAAILFIMGPSTVWAHGESPHGWATTGLASVRAFLFVTAPVSIWLAGLPHFQPRLRSVRPQSTRAMSWAVIGLLTIHLIALPPHLVHHLASPPDEGLKCTLFVQGNTSDQEGGEPVPLVIAPSLGGTPPTCPAPPALSHPIPSPPGRSPPNLWI